MRQPVLTGNHPSALMHAEILRSMRDDEVTTGRWFPIDAPPAFSIQAPLALVPKNSRDREKKRLIHDQSSPAGRSANDLIPVHERSVRYDTVRDLTSLIRSLIHAGPISIKPLSGKAMLREHSIFLGYILSGCCAISFR